VTVTVVVVVFVVGRTSDSPREQAHCRLKRADRVKAAALDVCQTGLAARRSGLTCTQIVSVCLPSPRLMVEFGPIGTDFPSGLVQQSSSNQNEAGSVDWAANQTSMGSFGLETRQTNAD
ncbi:unnamed protein product, partial [Protopolystoma xenopodis]